MLPNTNVNTWATVPEGLQVPLLLVLPQESLVQCKRRVEVENLFYVERKSLESCNAQRICHNTCAT